MSDFLLCCPLTSEVVLSAYGRCETDTTPRGRRSRRLRRSAQPGPGHGWPRLHARSSAARGQPDWARAINASVLAVRYVRGWGLEFEFVEQRFQHTLRRSPRKGLSYLWGTVTDESGKQGKGERFLRTCSGNANNRALPAKLCSEHSSGWRASSRRTQQTCRSCCQ